MTNATGAEVAVTYSDYLEGARNCLGYLGAREGEQVLLLPTHEAFVVDPMTVNALREVGTELGAHVSVMLIDALGTRGEPLPVVERAVKRSDLFIGIGDKTPNPITGHCLAALSARWDFGARQVDLRGGRGVLATPCSKFPTEVLLAIARHLHERLSEGGVIQMTAANGTDLRFPFDPQEVFFGGSFESDQFAAGQRCDWPLGQIMIHAEDGFAGIAMIDSVRGRPTILEKPARYEISGGCVSMEPRDETYRLIEEMAKPGNTSQVSKLFLGLNPKGSVAEGIKRSNVGTMAQAAGVSYIAIGDKAGFVASAFNTGGFMLHLNMSLNGELLMKDGRLTALDAPEVKATAERFGNAVELLTQLT